MFVVDQLKWRCFQHEAEEFLIWFCFENNGFSIEPIVKKDFIWSKIGEAFVSEDETVVDIANCDE